MTALNSKQKFKREIAYKLSISDIINGKFFKKEKRSYLTTPFGLVVNRARIFGIITDIKIFKQEQTEENAENAKKDYCYLVIDDGTETIRLKVWGDDIDNFKLKDLKVGENLDVIGKIRNFNQETYILPEIILKISDPNWELLREMEKIELKKLVKDKKIISKISFSEPSEEHNKEDIDNIKDME